ncbi:MAG: hypothetical protein WAU58_02380 [Terriglobales bacterium]|jgi:hypothetical protein
MLSKSMLLSVVLVLSSLAAAQGNTKQTSLPAGAVQGDGITTCDVTYTSGTSTTTTVFCVTANGNIPQFSIATEQMMGIAEGYGICDLSNNTSYYDYAQYDSGNWGPSTFAHSGNTITVKRTTSDGNWQLTQTIKNVGASPSGFGSAKISMKVENLSGSTRQAEVIRYADVDANSDFTNHFDTTSTSAFGLDGNFQHGLMITNNTFNNSYGYLTGVLDIAGIPDPCDPFHFLPPSLPYVGDGSILSMWSFRLANKGSATVTGTYTGI